MAATVLSQAARLRAVLPCLIVGAGLMLSGCAGWSPWTSKEKSARNAELYGPTANQRIKTLQEQAKAARESDPKSVEKAARASMKTQVAAMVDFWNAGTGRQGSGRTRRPCPL